MKRPSTRALSNLPWILLAGFVILEVYSKLVYVNHGLCAGTSWEGAIDEADVVFQGRANSRVHVPYWVTSTTFQVSRVIKGPPFKQFRIQLFPAIPLAYDFLYNSPPYDQGEYIVFARYFPFGLVDSYCSSSFPVSRGVDPELTKLISGSRPIPSLRGIDMGPIPGWLILGALCVASLTWQLHISKSNGSLSQGALRARRAASVSGAVAGAVFGFVVLALWIPPGLSLPSNFGDAAWDGLFLGFLAMIGAGYGMVIGFSLGPVVDAIIGSLVPDRRIVASVTVGALLGALLGISILGNLVFHQVLIASVMVSALGALLADRLLTNQSAVELQSTSIGQ